MDFRALKYLDAVARTGSLRAAAEKLHVSGSALSRMIAILENEAGMPLFERTSRGMLATETGEIYLRYARGVLFDQDRLKGEIQELRGFQRGHVKVVSIEGIVEDFVMAAFGEFRASHPGVSLGLRVFGSELVVESISRRDADLGLAANHPVDSSIETVLRLRTPLLLVTAPALAPERLRNITLRDAAAQFDLAIPDETFAIRRQLDACSQFTQTSLKHALVTNSVSALRSFARRALGATFLPLLAVREDIDRGRLVGIPLLDPLLQAATIEVIVPAGRWRSSATTAFLRVLEQTGRRLVNAQSPQFDMEDEKSNVF
jgi:DNA-binding transcriptional LysR family regulator